MSIEQDEIRMTVREGEVVRWLVDTNFPYDWQSLKPAPRWLRQPLAEEWARRDGMEVEDYLGSIDVEQVWTTEE